MGTTARVQWSGKGELKRRVEVEVEVEGEGEGEGEGRWLIDLGGNLKAVKGDWRVGVLGGDVFTLKEGEACATSAEYFRGEHIRDGISGEKISNGVYSVTVIHPTSAMIADALSTIMFLMGSEKGEQFLKEHYPEARSCWIFKE